MGVPLNPGRLPTDPGGRRMGLAILKECGRSGQPQSFGREHIDMGTCLRALGAPRGVVSHQDHATAANIVQ
jgi:hypothetical protein